MAERFKWNGICIGVVNDPGEYLVQNGLLHCLPSKLERPGRHEGHFDLLDGDFSENEELDASS